MLALSEPKTRPHQPRHPSQQPAIPVLSPSPSPGSHRRVGSAAAAAVAVATRDHRTLHERSHSDTPTLPLPFVDLSAEDSSVTSLSNLPLRKTLTSGKFHNITIMSLFVQNQFTHIFSFTWCCICCKITNIYA